MKTLATFIAGLALLFAIPAQAGDQATLNVLGFTSDGATFAFEEYGVQDGSGFPYANRFYIDTATDSFVAGTPIRVRLDDEMADVAQARDDAAMAATDTGLPADADLSPAFAAGINAITELSASPFTMEVNPRPVVPPINTPLSVRLEELPMLPTGTCEGITDTVMGFKLVQTATSPGETARLLHEDSSVPGSRSCPLGYRLGGIFTFFPDKDEPVFAVLIAIRSFGFEGPDYRWMAVTSKLNP